MTRKFFSACAMCPGRKLPEVPECEEAKFRPCEPNQLKSGNEIKNQKSKKQKS